MSNPTLIIVPSRFKAGTLYAYSPSQPTTPVQFGVTRATAATRVNASGLIESVASGVPRLDYLGQSCPGLLVEPAATNLFLNSAVGATQSITVTAVAHTLSFYGTGSITLSGVASGTLVGIGTGTANRARLTFTPTAGSLTLTVSGSITDVQLETGSVATSYIPTAGTAITRNADVISLTGASGYIGQTEGTIYVEVDVSNFTLFARAFAISDGTTSNRILILKQTNNRLALVVRTAGASIADIFTSTNQPTGNYKIAAAYSNNDFVFYVNGSLIGSVSSGAVPACNQVFLGKVETSTLGDQWNDRIRSAAIYNTRLSNDALAQLTRL